MGFIDLVKDGAIKAQSKYGICASLTIAQAILESGWGKYAPGNNLFGIKWTPGCGYDKQLLTTTEYYNGMRTEIQAYFRKYNSLDDSIYDHAQFLVKNSRYANLLGVKDYKKACQLIQQDGYATSPNYANQLIQIIEQNKLYEYDYDVYTSDFIKSVQHDLQRVSCLELGETNTDGVIGTKTKAAIKQFRYIVGLPEGENIDDDLVSSLNCITKKSTIGLGWNNPIIAVKFIQWYLGLPKTGIVDSKMAQAIKDWQVKAGIWSASGADGVIREIDWNKILK